MSSQIDTSDIKYAVPRADRIREGVKTWTGFWRKNPHRFAIEYFGMTWMRPFQMILLNIIMTWTYVMWFMSRGGGKTQMVAAAICCKATLYPGSKIVIAAGNRTQSNNVLNKIIDEFMPASQNLRNEIETGASAWKISPSDAYIRWKNGSIVRVVTARDSARSFRANWIICDEFVQIKKSIIDSVLRKFKAGQRSPKFYDLPKYKDWPKEQNCETYISSPYFKWHYSWDKFKAFFKQMVTGNDYICFGFPYQLPVREGYYPLKQIQDEMSEADFDQIKWSMEMDCLFWGESENAFYSFSDMDVNRSLQIPLYPAGYYQLLGDQKIKYRQKENGEIRLIGMDISVMPGASNDNTCFTLLQLLPMQSTPQFVRNLTYMEVANGGHTQDQAIRLRQLCDDFDVDYVVVDTNGAGIGVYDNLVRELADDERGVIYEPWSCINDEAMADRCNTPNAPKRIYSIKATAQFNNDAAVLLRDCLKRGKLKLLVSEVDANEFWMSNKQFQKLSPEDQALFQAPYYQTSSMIYETINLSYELVNGKIKVSEQQGMRKDRYSATSYANIIASQLERELLRPQKSFGVETISLFRKPKY